jgi:integrase
VGRDHPCWVGLDDNPFRELGMATAESNARLWTVAERDALIAAARAGNAQANDPDYAFPPFESLAAAIAINWWIGQREADVLGLPRDILERGVHTIVQEKTTAQVHLPLAMVPDIVEAVRRVRAANEAAGRAGLRLLIDEETGLTWTGDRFRRAFLRVRRVAAWRAEAEGEAALAASLRGLQFQWLRHTAVVLLEEAGCTVPEIASISGHTLGSVTQILERYGRRTRKQAQNAFRKRLEGEG